MERDRVVVVEGPDGPGSGYAIAARLVLTSAHAVPAPGGRVPVFRPGRAAEHPARVLWRGTPGGRDDAALLLVEDPAWTPPASGTPLRWGRLATTRPGTPCETWGAPDLVQHPGRPTDQLHPSGTLNPGDRDIGNRYAMNLDGHPPEPAAPGRSPWGGLSGAALFCGDLLTGVIAADPARRAHAVLEAVPAYVLLRDPGFRAALAAHGAGAGTVLEAVEWQHLDDPADRTAPFRSPAVLLHARRQTVPFRGREDLLAPLLDWTGRPGFGAHLLHGPGGQGKTRLAQHLADAAAERTQVLWLDAGAPPGELAVLAGTTRPLLVVVDYAETRAPQLLALLDAAHRHRGPHPFKLLLLARTAGDWWDNLQSATSRAADLLDGAPTTPLGPLEPEPGRSRTQAYREALDGYARHLPDVDDWQHHDWPALAARLRDREVDATALGTALTLHMTALADLLDAATGTTAGDTAPGAAKVEDRLLHHERRYWTAAAETCGLLPALSEATLADALTAAFLLGARDRAEGDAVLHRVPALADQTRDRRTLVSDWITSLYPPPGNDHRWGLLQPDRLAERFIGRHLTRHPELAHHLAPAVTRPQADHLLTLTTRATTHPGLHHLAPHLTTLIATHPATLAPAAIDAATQAERPGPLLDALQRIVDDPATPVSLLEELAAEIPSASHVLDPWAAQLFERLVTIHRGQPRHDPDRRSRLGRSLNRLAIRLGDLGRWEEALAVAEEAVLVHRGLVAVRPDEYLPQFGKVLNTLAIRLGDLGRWEEALAVAEEAILVHRGLVAVRPDEYLPQFGKVLNTLAIRLGDLGRWEEALAVAEEAVLVHRGLVAARLDEHLPDLATSLITFAVRLGNLGRREEALAVGAEAVRILRGLAAARPDAYLSQLATSLNNYAVQLGDLGRHEEALVAGEEAVRLRCELAAARLDEHLPDLAVSLSNVANWLGDLGEYEQALAVGAEAVRILRGLAAARPDAHLPQLAMSLGNLANWLGDLGEYEQALAVGAEAVRILRGLAAARPDAHLPQLAGILSNFAVQLQLLGRYEEALSAIEEAIRIRRALSAVHPDVHRPDLETSLRVQSLLRAQQDATEQPPT